VTDEPRIALRLSTGRLKDLTAAQALSLLANHPAIAHDWRKWTAVTRRRGRLILIDEKLVSEIAANLNSG
jgi:hypothetical protein